MHLSSQCTRGGKNAAGRDCKKKKAPASGKHAASKKQEGSSPGAGMVQTTVDDVSVTHASASGAKLVDPNTGKEVQMPSGDDDKPAGKKPASKKPASKAKNNKAGQLVDPNTGDKVEASSTIESKPAAKPSSSKQVKAEQTDDQAGASTSSAKTAPTSDKDQPVEINRAPVLTLWVAVVAERQGFSEEAGLTFGKAISGMLAHSKGRCDTILHLHRHLCIPYDASACCSNLSKLQHHFSLGHSV